MNVLRWFLPILLLVVAMLAGCALNPPSLPADSAAAHCLEAYAALIPLSRQRELHHPRRPGSPDFPTCGWIVFWRATAINP